MTTPHKAVLSCFGGGVNFIGNVKSIVGTEGLSPFSSLMLPVTDKGLSKPSENTRRQYTIHIYVLESCKL